MSIEDDLRAAMDRLLGTPRGTLRDDLLAPLVKHCARCGLPFGRFENVIGDGRGGLYHIRCNVAAPSAGSAFDAYGCVREEALEEHFRRALSRSTRMHIAAVALSEAEPGDTVQIRVGFAEPRGRETFEAALRKGEALHPYGCGFAERSRLCFLCERAEAGERTEHSARTVVDMATDAARAAGIMCGAAVGFWNAADAKGER